MNKIVWTYFVTLAVCFTGMYFGLKKTFVEDKLNIVFCVLALIVTAVLTTFVPAFYYKKNDITTGTKRERWVIVGILGLINTILLAVLIAPGCYWITGLGTTHSFAAIIDPDASTIQYRFFPALIVRSNPLPQFFILLTFPLTVSIILTVAGFSPPSKREIVLYKLGLGDDPYRFES